MNIRKLKLKKDMEFYGCFIPKGTILFDYIWVVLIGRYYEGDMNGCGYAIVLDKGSSDNEWWEVV